MTRLQNSSMKLQSHNEFQFLLNHLSKSIFSHMKHEKRFQIVFFFQREKLFEKSVKMFVKFFMFRQLKHIMINSI